MKSEFLYQYQERNGYPFRSKVFANIGKLSKLASKSPRFINFVNSTSPVRWVMGLAGITKKRELPDFARKTFSYWLKSTKPVNADKKVVLLNDTFTEHNTPQLGKFSINILNKLGYEVIVPPYTCCGRPMISKGFLKQAKAQATKLIKSLIPYVKEGHKVIGIEPSCILTVADDYPDLVSGEDAKNVAAACMTIDKFLANIVDKGEFDLDFHEGLAGLKVHGHCHQKAVEGTESTLKVLNALPDVLATEIDSGCCGMAGSFGYEKEHYDFSMQIGETRLFPEVRKAHSKEDIISNGMSCRCQISHGAKRTPTHMIEFLNSRIKNSMSSTII